MQFILYLIQKNRTFLLFLFLELIALFFTVQFHSYQKSKFINSANAITGGLYQNITSFRSYLHLREENTLLAEENVSLRNQLLKKIAIKSILTDSVDLKFNQKFKYTTAKIINNDFHKRNNFLTLNKGENHDISPDMAILNNKGIIGITTNTSDNYASAISVLNTNFKINARLKHANYFGTLKWNGISKRQVQLVDIPRQATLKIGDTIITGGRSTIFPEGILIGSVSNIEQEHNRYKNIDVTLFNDVTNLTNVYIVSNLHKIEIKKIEQENE